MRDSHAEMVGLHLHERASYSQTIALVLCAAMLLGSLSALAGASLGEAPDVGSSIAGEEASTVLESNRGPGNGGREVTHRVYDMFKVPWGDWWYPRWGTYGCDIIVGDDPGMSTMLYRPARPGYVYQGIVYAPYRYAVDAKNITTLDVDIPEFLPSAEYLRTSPYSYLANAGNIVPGAEATVGIYFQYLTPGWWNGWWVPTWTGHAGFRGNIYTPAVDDGWWVGTIYNMTMNRAAAEEWLGLSQSVANPVAWWNSGVSLDFTATFEDWVITEGNDRLDIFNGYEAIYSYIWTGADLTVNATTGDIEILMGHICWGGYEVLMTRWLTETEITGHQSWFEDFALTASYNRGSTNLTMDTVCQCSLRAVKANGTADGSAWVWEPTRVDYINRGGHPSDWALYENLRYQSWNAGDALFGTRVPYERTPQWFNLSGGERLVIEMPKGEVPGFMGVGLTTGDYDTIAQSYNDWTYGSGERDFSSLWAIADNRSGGLVPGYMISNHPDNNLTPEHDSAANTLTFEGPMSFDNFRHWPDGALYHSAPWIEMRPADAPAGWVVGQVTDAFSGAPVVDAEVGISDEVGCTDGSGKFNVSVAPGTHPMNVSAGGYATDYSSVEVTLWNVTYRNVTLVPLSLPPGSTELTHTIYDMFEEPWGAWWNTRGVTYNSSCVLTSDPGMSTMMYWPGRLTHPDQALIYAPYRLGIDASNFTSIDIDQPEFMPSATYLGHAPVAGAEATVGVYFQYIDISSWNSYWLPAWGPFTVPYFPDYDDGYLVGTVYDVAMNREAAEEWLGLPQGEDPMTWWVANNDTYGSEWEDWIGYEGNVRLDIYPAYGWAYSNIFVGMKLMQNGSEVVLHIGLISWGYEILMSRWLVDAGLTDAGGWYEDFSLVASYDRAGATNLTSDMVCQFGLHAVKANGTSDGAAWAWEPHLNDFLWVPPNPTPYWIYDDLGLTYQSWNAGDAYFGQQVPYEFTPTWMNLSVGEKLVIEVPAGTMPAFRGTGLTPADHDAIRAGDLSSVFAIMRNGTAEPGFMVTNHPYNSIVPEYDPSRRTLTFQGSLEFENARHVPSGALYHGAPWIEIDVSPAVPGRSVSYHFYDMFNVPFGEWWDMRWDVYGYQEPLTYSYPYIYRYYASLPGNEEIRANLRLNISANDLPEVNMNSNPEFLPLLGAERGGAAEIDWYMQYLTSDEMTRYPSFTNAWLDGWVICLNGTVRLDRTAAMAVLNLTSDGWSDFATWWGLNGNTVNAKFSSWMIREAGRYRLDIYNMYEYPLTILYWDLTAEKIGEEVVLSYDLVSWGMEALMARWLREAFMPTEWYYEDMRFRAKIGPERADIHIDTVVTEALHAWVDLDTMEPIWAFDARLGDYVPSTPAHLKSDFDPYVGKTYLCRAAGNYWYGMWLDYDYTPTAWNLSAGESLTFEWAPGPVLFADHIPGAVPAANTFEFVTAPMIVGSCEPDITDLPFGVLVDTLARAVTFTGPIDFWAWSKYQSAHPFLESEWDRLGILPYGMPYLAWAPAASPPEPTRLGVGGVPDPIGQGEQAMFTVTCLDQYGGSYPNYTGTVMFSSTDASADLPVPYTFVPVDMGTKSFTVTFNTPGEHDLYAIDSDNASMWGAQVGITVLGPDTAPPVANAGPDGTVYLGASTTLDGRSSTDDRGIVNYTWSFVDAVPVMLYGSVVSHEFSALGVYSIMLNVSDAAGNFDTDEVMVTVVDGTPPVADAGPDLTVSVGGTATLDGSASVDNVGVVSYEWSFYDGEAKTLTGAVVQYTFSNPGSFVVTLTVADAAGNGDSDTLVVSVVDNLPPVADAGPDIVVAPSVLVELNGSGSTDNVGVIGYTWTFYDGGVQVLVGMVVSHAFSLFGTYTVTLAVSDAAGNTDTDTMVVTVRDVTPPVARAGSDMVIMQGETVTFNASGSTDDTSIVLYFWTFEDGGSRMLFGSVVSYTFSYPGVYSVSLVVVDVSGNSGTDTVTVTVLDGEDPVADAGGDVLTSAGMTVTFDGSDSTDNVGIVSYTWTLYDGELRTLTGLTVDYVFDSPGTYVVALSVADAAGNGDTDTLTATVMPANRPPVADAGKNVTIFVGEKHRFNGSKSVDPDGTGPLNFTWTFAYSNGDVTFYGVMPEFTFGEPGVYQVHLTVKDNGGMTAQDSVTVTVQERAGTAFFDSWWGPVAIALVAACVTVLLLLGWRRARSGAFAQPPEEPPAERPDQGAG